MTEHKRNISKTFIQDCFLKHHCYLIKISKIIVHIRTRLNFLTVYGAEIKLIFNILSDWSVMLRNE